LNKANSELQDTISLCEIKGGELAHLISRIRKELRGKNISLDYLEQ